MPDKDWYLGCNGSFDTTSHGDNLYITVSHGCALILVCTAFTGWDPANRIQLVSAIDDHTLFRGQPHQQLP